MPAAAAQPPAIDPGSRFDGPGIIPPSETLPQTPQPALAAPQPAPPPAPDFKPFIGD